MVSDPALARREREIVHALYRLGPATAREVRISLPHPVSYSTIRTQLRVLERKGHVRCERGDRGYIYSPAIGRHIAGRRALRQIVEIYFDGCKDKAIALLQRF